jgi:DNA topoisomerase-2
MSEETPDIEKEYVKLEQLDHVLKRPGLYIGSENPAIVDQYLVDIPLKYAENDVIVPPPVNPENNEPFSISKTSCLTHEGLLKCFDEVVMNAEDQRRRVDKLIKEGGGARQYPVTRIECTFSQDGKSVTIKNNGNGIRVEFMKNVGMYPVGLVFGNLFASSNFNDEKRGDIIGMNGMGAKLTNIFAKRFIVETVCHVSGKKLVQEWRNNMRESDEPIVTSVDPGTEPYTSITWFPDFEKFKITEGRFTMNLLRFCYRRMYDIAGVSSDGISGPSSSKVSHPDSTLVVLVNNYRLQIPDFLAYVRLYLKQKPVPVSLSTETAESAAAAAAESLPSTSSAAPPTVEQPDPIVFHVFDRQSKGWQIVLSPSTNDEFEHISFVNGSITMQGGTHVEYVADMLRRALRDILVSKKIDVPLQSIKNQFWLFVNATNITKPEFSSQSKDRMIKHIDEIRREWPYTPCKQLVQKVLHNSSPIMQRILALVRVKEIQELSKTDGVKVNHIMVDKLDDAKYAGGPQSEKCTLIITEGDSAKAMVMGGLSVLGRDYYGVYPLRGKPANVRECSSKQIKQCRIIQTLKQILALKTGEDYMAHKQSGKPWPLRYGRVLLMMDQDIDGSHITGLVLNLFDSLWPSLLHMKKIGTILTPIVKVFKGKETKEQFYSIQSFEKWLEDHTETSHQYHVKYFKGLGTSASEEAMSYFRNLRPVMYEKTDPSIIIPVVENENDNEPENDNENDNAPDADTISRISTESVASVASAKSVAVSVAPSALVQHTSTSVVVAARGRSRRRLMFGTEIDPYLDRAFNKKRSTDRKQWLAEYDRNQYANYDEFQDRPMSTQYFCDYILRHYSIASVIRAVPNFIDGLKPAQRKILYAAFSRKSMKTKEIKVAQFAAYAAERTCYHHGEVSMMETIKRMAQDFLGSNNINLFSPNGQFGSRIKGGSDSAHGRYIHTCLSPITRSVFKDQDDPFCTYLEEDGELIEPEYYLPVIPLVLVNGSTGIGTGFSSTIPCHNPIEICAYIECLLNSTRQGASLDTLSVSTFTENGLSPLHLFYLGFQGTFVRYKNRWYTRGKYDVVTEERDTVTLRITELPIGVWTDDYKAFLEENLISPRNENKNAFIVHFEPNYHERTVDFTITLPMTVFKNWHRPRPEGILELEHQLHLVTMVSLDNMHVFDENRKITKFDTAEELILAWFKVRIFWYYHRKECIVKSKKETSGKLVAQSRFIREITSDETTRLNIGKIPRAQLLEYLVKNNYPTFEDRPLKGSTPISDTGDTDGADQDQLIEEVADDNPDIQEKTRGYNYILKLPLSSLTIDEANKLSRKSESCLEEIDRIHNTAPEDIWQAELNEFKVAFEKHKNTVLEKYALEMKNLRDVAAAIQTAGRTRRAHTSQEPKRKKPTSAVKINQ